MFSLRIDQELQFHGSDLAERASRLNQPQVMVSSRSNANCTHHSFATPRSGERGQVEPQDLVESAKASLCEAESLLGINSAGVRESFEHEKDEVMVEPRAVAVRTEASNCSFLAACFAAAESERHPMLREDLRATAVRIEELELFDTTWDRDFPRTPLRSQARDECDLPESEKFTIAESPPDNDRDSKRQKIDASLGVTAPPTGDSVDSQSDRGSVLPLIGARAAELAPAFHPEGKELSEDAVLLLNDAGAVEDGIKTVCQIVCEPVRDADVKGRLALCRKVLNRDHFLAPNTSYCFIQWALLPCFSSDGSQREFLLACTDLCEVEPRAAVEGLLFPLLCSPSYGIAGGTLSPAAFAILRKLPQDMRAEVVRQFASEPTSAPHRGEGASPEQNLVIVRVMKQYLSLVVSAGRVTTEESLRFSALLSRLRGILSMSCAQENRLAKSVAEEVAALVQKSLLRVTQELAIQHAAAARHLLQQCVGLGVSSSSCKSALRKVDKLLSGEF